MTATAGTEAGDGLTTVSSDEYERLRQRAEKAQELEERVAQIERLGAFVEAGFDLDNPTDQVFIKGYDGDLTTEAIQGAAEKAGWQFAAGDTDSTPPARGGWDQNSPGEGGVSGSGGMKEALEEAAQKATSQDDLNQRIIEVYRSYGEKVASDLE